MELATCKICVGDFDVESMIEDIQGAKYCLLDSGDICPVCGTYEHNCEETKDDETYDTLEEKYAD